uniref:Uncharacterized protein n=1 Tax=Rhodopseudomonas palustris (strain DX-1) TaxID=652103 RepID=E6VFJ1_RHOPX
MSDVDAAYWRSRGAFAGLAASAPAEPAPQPKHDPRSPILQTIAAALAIDQTARATGYADREAGRPFQPGSHDILSYASGWHAGRPPRAQEA